MYLLPKKIHSRFFITNLIIVFIVVFFFLWFFNISFSSFYYEEKENDLKARATLISSFLKSYSNLESLDLSILCKKFKNDTNTRYTIIDLDGKVLGDSDEEIIFMDNHINRPEIEEAISGRIGTSIRYSNTLKTEMLYLAINETINNDIYIIRSSVPIGSLQKNIIKFNFQIIVASSFIIVVSLLISLLVSRKIVNPIEKMVVNAKLFAKGDFSNRILPSNTFEINSLSKSLNLMAKQLDERIKLITLQKNESDAILSSMSEGIIATNQMNKIIKANNNFREVFNLKGRAIGKDILKIIDNNDFLLFYNKLINHRMSKKIELTIDNINNRTILLYGTKLKNEDGDYIGNVIILNDITKIRSLERVRKEFVANVSHELKTPLTALKGYVETLKEVDNEKDSMYFLEILDKHTTRMNLIINDLLELSKLEEADQSKLLIENININAMIEDAILECQYASNKKNIQIFYDLNDETYFNLNKRLIQEALVNIIHNSIQYSSNNTDIFINSYIEKNKLHISVKDNGIGINQNEIKKIFNRFYCVDKSHSKKTGGTGLGLAIVKHIINLHGGKVNVNSEIGKGSQFMFILPKPKNV
ncbi:MAG: hypothetical protein CMG07_00550 [Candidatus Marinimicrobia bacterium]|nr:hypothetical protein [Candidatus Neomarinimicrobiota bacterium]